MTARTYLVIGVYADDHCRFANDFEAEGPEEAEAMAIDRIPNLIIAAVINEEGQIVS